MYFSKAGPAFIKYSFKQSVTGKEINGYRAIDYDRSRKLFTSGTTISLGYDIELANHLNCTLEYAHTFCRNKKRINRLQNFDGRRKKITNCFTPSFGIVNVKIAYKI